MAAGRKTRQRRRGGPIPASPRPASSPGKNPAKNAGGSKTPLHQRLREVIVTWKALGILVLCLLATVAYFPATNAGFLWDDVIFTDSAPIRAPFGIWPIWFVRDAIEREGHYWPVLYSTFWLEHKLWGLDPRGYHIVNVFLHLANVLLLWRILQRLAIPGAWLAAALFAVHPTHVEPIAWVIARKDLLAALFSFASILAWIHFTDTSRKGLSYLQSLGFYTASMLSKSTAVTLAPILLVLQWWRNGRITSTDLFRVVPFFLVGTWITLADLAFYQSRDSSSFSHTFLESVLIAARAFWFYTAKLLWPTELAVIYPRWEIDVTDPLGWGYVAAGLALATVLWFFRHRIGRGPLAGALFFVIILLPVLGFVGYSYMQFAFVADRYQYLAGAGPIAVFAGIAVTLAGRLPQAARIGAAVAAGLMLALLGTLSWKQTEHYENEITLFGHIAGLNPKAYSAYTNLSKGLLDVYRNEEALAAAISAVGNWPNHSDAHVNAAVAYGRLGQLEDTERHYRRALEIMPQHRAALTGLSEFLLFSNRPREARQLNLDMIEKSPNFAPAYAQLGEVLVAMKRYDKAIETLEQAISLGLRPVKESRTRVNIGKALRAKGQEDAAETQFQNAFQLSPKNWSILSHLTIQLFDQKRFEEAAVHLRGFLEHMPNRVEAHYNLGLVLGHSEQFAESRQSFNRAIELDPNHESSKAGLIWLQGEEQKKQNLQNQ